MTITPIRSYLQTHDVALRSPVACMVHDDVLWKLSIERLRGRQLNGIQQPRQAVRGHTHCVYHIILYTAGEARITYQSETVTCRAGTLMVINPNENHAFALSGKQPHEFIALTFRYESDSGDQLALPLSKVISHFAGQPIMLPASPIRLSPNHASLVQGALETLMEKLFAVRDERWDLKVSAAFIGLLAGLTEIASRSPGSPLRATDERITRAQSLIASRRNERLRLGDLARAAGMSNGHFIRTFKKIIGTTPIDYQLRLRVESAQQLLLTSDRSIEEVANETGFDNPFYFTRVFKRIVGVPPSRFRSGHAEVL